MAIHSIASPIKMTEVYSALNINNKIHKGLKRLSFQGTCLTFLRRHIPSSKLELPHFKIPAL